MKSLQEAENRFLEASQNLEFAKQQFEASKGKSEQIRNQGYSVANQLSQKLMDLVESDITRLKENSLSTMKFEEEKSIIEVVLY